MENLLIVDDSPEIRKQLQWGLGKEYTLHAAGEPSEALALFSRHHPKVVLLDLSLSPDGRASTEGLDILGEIMKSQPLTKVVMITGNEERENALKALSAGAYDYLQKPVDIKELKVIVNRAFYLHELEEENRRLHSTLEAGSSAMTGMVGHCPQMIQVFATIRKVATTDVSVLIQGESGTGKELVARALHALSLRNAGPFISINCGAIPETLIESELFGHEKGAFTGAIGQVPGKVEYADKGTLFLDEIGELPAHLQVKLLRFLQERTLQRIGGRENISVDVRIIAATNVDIAKAIASGKFREDLFYRIGVVTMHLPLLRERGEDILLLANLFLKRFAGQFSRKIRGFSQAAQESIKSFDWPGNVRELENRIQRAVIMAETPLIGPQDLGFSEEAASRLQTDKAPKTLLEARTKMEREMIMAVLSRHGGNIVKSAEELGISRPTLYDLMKRHRLTAS